MNNSPEQQDALFPIEVVLPDFDGRETDTSSKDRAERLIEVLELYDKTAEIDADIRRFNDRNWLKNQEEQLGKNVVYKWRRQKHEKHQEVLDEAKQTFLQAYPVTDLVATGMDEEQATNERVRQYGIFEQAYRGTSQGRHEKREKARAEYRLYLEAAPVEEKSADATISQQHVIEAVGSSVLRHTLEPDLAQTKDKLIGLRDDTRAGFLPTTHTEKSQAFEILDYMDASKYPKGVTRRLEEIFIHQQKIAREKGLMRGDIYTYGLEAVTSITQEWGDHLRSAIIGYQELSKLKDLLDSGINPRISTLEALETGPNELYDYNALVRFINLKSLRDEKAFAFDPLRTREDRSIIHPGKNKIIEDVHTASGSIIAIQDYIDQVARELTVKDGRTLIDEALADQSARRLFWYRTLKAVVDYGGEGFQDQAHEALITAGAPTTA